MMKNDLIQTHLDRVSRSFAFCIRQLPDPLRLWVGESYLLCRIVDTIEDSDYTGEDLRHQAFDWFDQSLLNETGGSYPKDLWPVLLSEGEELLLKDTQAIFEIFHEMDPTARDRVRRLALSMSRGMRHFRARSAGGILKLADLKEVNQYCFFVAGLVGEMLLGFLSQLDGDFSFSLSRLLKAHHFGLFLQKVNLLKDQLKDEKLGRFLVPMREEVAASARENAKEAFHFLEEIPLRHVEFRRFCAWSLFLGLESLKGDSKKLSRRQTEQVLLQVEENLQDAPALRNHFSHVFEALGGEFSASPIQERGLKPSAPAWIEELYQGELKPLEMGALGLS